MVLAVLVMLHGGHSAATPRVRERRATSLSDLHRVFLHRGIGPTALPYIASRDRVPGRPGVFLYLASIVSDTPLGVLFVTALASAVLCVVITIVLELRVGRQRVAVGARTPRVPLRLPELGRVRDRGPRGRAAGVRTWTRPVAGITFGVGAAVKLFPAVVLPPLVALRWVRGDRQGACRLALISLGTFFLVNLPVLIANPSGWWWPYSFQSRRKATWGTAWFYLFRDLRVPVHGAAGAQFANDVSMLALVAGLGLAPVRDRPAAD